MPRIAKINKTERLENLETIEVEIWPVPIHTGWLKQGCPGGPHLEGVPLLGQDRPLRAEQLLALLPRLRLPPLHPQPFQAVLRLPAVQNHRPPELANNLAPNRANPAQRAEKNPLSWARSRYNFWKG